MHTKQYTDYYRQGQIADTKGPKIKSTGISRCTYARRHMHACIHVVVVVLSQHKHSYRRESAIMAGASLPVRRDKWVHEERFERLRMCTAGMYGMSAKQVILSSTILSADE